MNGLEIRRGKLDDYAAFLAAEATAWKGTNVKLISPEQFSSWLEVFPEGLLVAEYNGRIVGHLFSQVCNFDPYDPADNRCWAEMTDEGLCRRSHDPNADTVYTVSLSAHFPGAGKKLLREGFAQCREFKKRYYAGASSIPGFEKYAASVGQPMDRVTATEYVAGIMRKLGLREGFGPRLSDPVISVTLGIEGVEFVRLIENYFEYSASGNWAVLIVYENPDWRP